MKKNIITLLIFSFVSAIIGIAPAIVNADTATLYISPKSGTFFMGSTFNVSVYINTKGEEVNTIDVDLKFPPDIIQVTSPLSGESFVSQWLSPPTYSNATGKISFRGGMPGGITTSAGLISTITFRAKMPGRANIEFLDSSKVLLNDGKGTSISPILIGGSYQISVPPSEGPRLSSASHPDYDIWYQDNNPSFNWVREYDMTDFSFSLSQNPQEEPDEVSEGDVNFKSYTNVAGGIWYFHLRAKKSGVWGKASHYVIKIDNSPPQSFNPEVDAYSRFVYFETKDIHSGMDYYEISIRDLGESEPSQPFFTEIVSPYKIPYEKSGRYSIIIRAFDKSGNLRQEQVTFRLISPILSYIEGKGLQFKNFLLPRSLIYVIGFGIGYLIIVIYKRRGKFGFKKATKEIEEALSEIEKIEKRERETEKVAEEFSEEFEERKQELEEKLKKREKFF